MDAFEAYATFHKDGDRMRLEQAANQMLKAAKTYRKWHRIFPETQAPGITLRQERELLNAMGDHFSLFQRWKLRKYSVWLARLFISDPAEGPMNDRQRQFSDLLLKSARPMGLKSVLDIFISHIDRMWSLGGSPDPQWAGDLRERFKNVVYISFGFQAASTFWLDLPIKWGRRAYHILLSVLSSKRTQIGNLVHEAAHVSINKAASQAFAVACFFRAGGASKEDWISTALEMIALNHIGKLADADFMNAAAFNQGISEVAALLMDPAQSIARLESYIERLVEEALQDPRREGYLPEELQYYVTGAVLGGVAQGLAARQSELKNSWGRKKRELYYAGALIHRITQGSAAQTFDTAVRSMLTNPRSLADRINRMLSPDRRFPDVQFLRSA